MNLGYFTYTIEIGYYDPWTSAWMTGHKLMGAFSEQDKIETVARYDAYYKETYGPSAYCWIKGEDA